MRGKGQKRIAIVYPYSNFDANPSMCNTADILAEEGYLVEIYKGFFSKFVPPDFQNKNIIVQPPYPGRRDRKGIHRIIPARWSQPLAIRERHREIPYHAFIGIDPGGLIKASFLNQFTGVPLVYYSFELMLSQEFGGDEDKKTKADEVRLSRKASFIIIQDEDRAKLLSNDNSIPMEKFVYVPNSPLGPARRQKKDYWHKKFDLSPQTKVVLHSGSINEWTGLDGIVESVKGWPDDYVLVIHTQFESSSYEILHSLKEKGIPGKVFFSLQPVPRTLYDQLVDSADIGIAFYLWVESGNSKRNLATIGLSSGKAAYALRSGLPVIMNRIQGLPDLIEKYRCGIVVENFNEIGSAISRIDQSYAEYSEASMELFNTHLDFSAGFQKALERLNAL